MSESEIRKIGASITNDEFEVNADLSQVFSWSLGCSIIVEDTNADIQEIKNNDICLSGNVYIEELTVDINRVVFSNGLNVDFGITELDVNFGVVGVGGIGGAVIDEIGELKDSLKDVNDALVGINQESVNIKATINGIQSTVNDIGTELVNKASVKSVTEIGASITEIQNNQYEQSVKLDVLGTEISTKASSESVTKIADVLVITNQTLAEQTTKVNDIGVQITTKAEASQVTEIEEGLKAASDSIAEQSTKVTALESQISTKAETETVTQLGESINIVSENVAEQIIRTDGIEASIENLVTNEVFNAATGEIESSITSVEQRTESIETTIKSQGGEITSIKENVNGLSIGIGNLESDLDSLRNQMDGVTESFFYAYSPTNDNEPAKTWIEQGKQAEHKGDTFTNTATEGDGAGKSWRWLQDNNGNWGWHPIADTDAQKALVLAAQAQATADGKVSIFYIQPSNYKEGDIWFVHNDEYSPYEKGEILTAIAGGTIFSISDWESKTRYTEAVKDLDKTMNTTFKDGVLDEAERLTIIEGVTALTNEKSAVDARYNITIVNSDLTDEALKNEYKATKATYDSAYNNLVGIVEQIADTKAESLKDLFDSYTTASENYTEAYSAHNEKETQVTEALMGRLNSASRYLDNITNDGILTPIEKEQLFEIYRNIAKEYDATRSNALNYKIWKYNVNGYTEEAGLNGGDGRYESYVAFKNAYTAIANVFSSSMWGFTQMNESTTLPKGYTTTLLKEYLDTYYETYGILTESFSAITAAIEAAQKATEATLKELTDNLLPEEMSTTVGKGVVLSTIIATKDVNGNITAGMNASSSHSHPVHGRVVFVGGAKDINDFNNASYVVYEDGHVKMYSAEIEEYASKIALQSGLLTKADVTDFESLAAIVTTFASMWRLENGVLKTDYDVLTNGQFAAATVGESTGGGVAYLADLYDVSLGSLLSGDILSWNGSEWVNIKQSSIVPDLSSYATKSFVTDSLVGYAKQSDVTSALSNYLPLTGGTISGNLTVDGYIVKSGHYFGVNNNDNAEWYVTDKNWQNTYTLIHSGNIGSQSVASATKLATPRTIWGQSFDGTSNITGSVIIQNNSGIYIKDTAGSNKHTLLLSSANNLLIGQETAIAGYNTYIYGNNLYFKYGNNTGVAMTINTSGNVTIGAGDLAGTSTKLYVDGGIRFAPRTIWGQSFDGTGNVSGVLLDINNQEFIYSSGTWTRVGNGTAKAGLPTYIDGNDIYLRYGKSPTIGLILNSSGNVIIGTTTDSGAKLTVDGIVRAKGFKSQTLSIECNNAGTDYYGYGWSIDNYNNPLYIQASTSANLALCSGGGNVLIGTTDDSGYKLDVYGTLRTTDTITAQNGIVTNEISIGGVRIDSVGGVLRINGDVFSTGQFAASLVGEEGGGGGVMLLTSWPSASGDYSGYALGGNLGVELNNRVKTLEGKATAVSFSQTLTSGKEIGTLTIDGVAKSLYAPSMYDWSEINAKPTHLSQFTDDVVAGKYLPLSGGIIESSLAAPLEINSTSQSEVGVAYRMGGTYKGWIGYNPTYGAILYNYPSNAYLGIRDNGKAYLDNNELLHSGNYSEYAVKYVGGSSIDAARHCIGYDNTSEGSANMPDGYGGGFISADQGHYGFQMLGVAGINKLYFRSLYNDTYLDWSEIYHSGNFNPLDYLPLSGGTMQGDIVIPMGNYVRVGSAYSDYAMFGHNSSGILVGTPNLPLVLRSNGTSTINGNTLYHTGNFNPANYLPLSGGTIESEYSDAFKLKRKGVAGAMAISFYNDTDGLVGTIGVGGTLSPKGKVPYYSDGVDTYPLIHSGNIGSQSVASATKLATPRTIWGQSFDGTSNITGSVIIQNNSGIYIKDTAGSNKHTLLLSSANNLLIGQETAIAGYNTYIYGNNLYFKYGNNTGVAMTINTSGNVTIGAGDLAGTSTKLYVDGGIRFAPRTIWGQSFDGTGDVSGNLIYNGETFITNGTSFTSFGNTARTTYIDGNGIWFNSSGHDVVFSSSGNVLIGTTTDRGHRLTVGRPDGAANLSSTTLNNSLLFVGMSESVYSYGTNFWTEGSGNGFIQQGRTDEEQPALYDLILQPFGRNVGIGTPNPAYKLDVTGTLRVTDTLTAQNGITTNEITIGGIRICVENGALKVNGDIYATGQFASGTVGN